MAFKPSFLNNKNEKYESYQSLLSHYQGEPQKILGKHNRFFKITDVTGNNLSSLYLCQL